MESMKGQRKPFDQENYDRNDRRGKEAVKTFLRSKGWSINDEEDFGPDLKAFRINPDGTTDERWYQVGVKEIWKDEWPKMWTDLQIAERRKMSTNRSDGLPVWFWELRNDLKEGWLFHESAFYDDKGQDQPRFEVRNSYMPCGEFFYKLPFDQKILRIRLS